MIRFSMKPLLGLLLGIPSLFLLLHSMSSTSGDYTEYAMVYSDGGQISKSGSPSSSSSASSASAPSSTSTDLASEEQNSLVPVESRAVASDLPTAITSVRQSCICDNSASQLSSSQFSKVEMISRAVFTPNEPIYDDKRVIIFVITPTYTRPTQMADMTRLAQTLKLVPDLFWIVVEDSHNYSRSVRDLLLRTRIPHVQLLGPRPPTHMDKRSGRGVSNRRKAFQWLRDNYLNTNQTGVIYFADDDNAYDERVFEEMRDTKIVSMFPVGLISTLGLSTPIVSKKTGKIIGFHDPFIGRRKFAVDMAGFAVNLQYFLVKKKATMPYKVGYEEDYFLKSLGVKIFELEPKAKNCTEVLVWHTKTKAADNPKVQLMQRVTKYNDTNLPLLYERVLEH